MRYAEFRDRLEDALREAGFFFHDADRVETIDLADTVRSWKSYVGRAAPLSAEPFHVSAVVGFEWGPADSARAYTCEEDLLTEFVGRRRRPIRRRSPDSGRFACPGSGTTPSVAKPRGTHATSLVAWRGSSRQRLMSGRRVSRNSRLGSDTRRQRREQSRSSLGSTIDSRTMMMTGRKRHTNWWGSGGVVLCGGSMLPLAAT